MKQEQADMDIGDEIVGGKSGDEEDGDSKAAKDKNRSKILHNCLPAQLKRTL